MFKQAYLYAKLRDGSIPDLYVQSQKYWEPYKEEIRSMWQSGIGHIDMVSLQIRRGDYVNNSFYNDLTQTDYYDKAIEMFKGEKFLIFCADRQGKDNEDIQWCKNWADSKKINYEIHYPGRSETDDLNDMASCKHNIIANSTFGWWAGFLNPNVNKKVVCPKSWFSDGIQRCELPEEFIQI